MAPCAQFSNGLVSSEFCYIVPSAMNCSMYVICSMPSFMPTLCNICSMLYELAGIFDVLEATVSTQTSVLGSGVGQCSTRGNISYCKLTRPVNICTQLVMGLVLYCIRAITRAWYLPRESPPSPNIAPGPRCLLEVSSPLGSDTRSFRPSTLVRLPMGPK